MGSFKNKTNKKTLEKTLKMKFTLLILAVTIAVASASQSPLREWIRFKQTHAKTYEKEEDKVRFNLWSSNKQAVIKHNAEADSGKHTFWLAMNKFADMSSAEFVQFYNGYNATKQMIKGESNMQFVHSQNVQVPDSVDWRTEGYVTPVKNQAQCGSCWAFSTTGSLEGQHFKSTGNLVSLSEQNLVDCSAKTGNMGCNGGLMDQAFKYIKENAGLDTEASYVYTGKDDTCRFNAANVGATVTGFVDVKSKDEDALKQAVGTVGPVSVAIDASHVSFQLYSHGVYHQNFCSETRLDHGVLTVGYGTEQDGDFWWVKNSWGASWGLDGYIKMSRNRKNNCGIATTASYPTV